MRHRMALTAFIVIWLCVLGIVSTGYAEPFEVRVLDVGQGQAVFIEADGHYMLIDGGGRGTSSFTVSYLKQQGVDKFDYIAVSHYDEDHMSGIIGALNVFPCAELMVPPYAGEGDLYQSLATAALSNGCDIIHPPVGRTFEVGNAHVEVVGPVRNDYTSGNDLSLCFRIRYGNCHILICGDAEQTSEMDLVSSGQNLSADVYVVNHHGSSTSTMDSFLDAVNPTYAVISCGIDNAYGHPSMETMQRLQNHGISMFRTDDQGTVIVYSDGSDIWFNVEPSENWAAGQGSMGPVGVENRMAQENTEESGIVNDPAEETEEKPEYRYVCNTNTKKIHYPDCKSVAQMKEENRLYTNLSKEELLAQGYEPCGNCSP